MIQPFVCLSQTASHFLNWSVPYDTDMLLQEKCSNNIFQNYAFPLAQQFFKIFTYRLPERLNLVVVLFLPLVHSLLELFHILILGVLYPPNFLMICIQTILTIVLVDGFLQ